MKKITETKLKAKTPIDNSKCCSRCGISKALTDFHKDRSKGDGLYSCCKNCHNQYYQDNKEKMKEHSNQYYQDNKEKMKQYRIDNPEKIKQHYQDNKEKIKKRQKQYRQNNPEKIKQYFQDNKEKLDERRKNRYDTRTKLVESFKESCAICGFRDKPALVFHHIDPKEKKFTISNSKDTVLESLQEEIAKCIILCSNCHRIFHYYDHNPSERPEFLLKKYLKLGLKISKTTEVQKIRK